MALLIIAMIISLIITIYACRIAFKGDNINKSLWLLLAASILISIASSFCE